MTTVVFFLGGCTYTEIAALRWVARQNRGLSFFRSGKACCAHCSIGRHFIVATTGIVSASSLIDGIAGISKSGGSKDAGI